MVTSKNAMKMACCKSVGNSSTNGINKRDLSGAWASESYETTIQSHSKQAYTLFTSSIMNDLSKTLQLNGYQPIGPPTHGISH